MARTTRRAALALLGAAVLAAFGCAAQEVVPEDAAADGDTFTLTGTIVVAGGGRMPPGAVTVRLEEHGIADAPARGIAVSSVESDGNSRQVDFTMKVSRAALATVHMPGFSVRVERFGRLTANNTTRQPYNGGTTVRLEIEPIQY